MLNRSSEKRNRSSVRKLHLLKGEFAGQTLELGTRALAKVQLLKDMGEEAKASLQLPISCCILPIRSPKRPTWSVRHATNTV